MQLRYILPIYLRRLGDTKYDDDFEVKKRTPDSVPSIEDREFRNPFT